MIIKVNVLESIMTRRRMIMSGLHLLPGFKSIAKETSLFSKNLQDRKITIHNQPRAAEEKPLDAHVELTVKEHKRGEEVGLNKYIQESCVKRKLNVKAAKE